MKKQTIELQTAPSLARTDAAKPTKYRWVVATLFFVALLHKSNLMSELSL